MGYLALMTLTGSFLYAGYLVWAKKLGHILNQTMRYKALVAVLLSYAVPWVWIRGAYSSLLRMFLRRGFAANGGVSVNIADIRAEGGAYKTMGYWQIMLIVFIWVGGAMWHMSRKYIAFFRGKRALLTLAEECSDAALEPIVRRLKKEFHYKGRLRIIKTQRNSSLTIGAIRPVIALQKYDSDMELEWILRHEMVHIVRKDLWWKMLMELVHCLQWFNPAVRGLSDRFNFICETSCDERVLRGCSAGEREFYGRLVTKSMQKHDTNVMFSSAFGDDQKNAQERIELIMKPRSSKSKKKMAAVGMFTAMVMASSLTAFAYPHVYQVEDTAVEVAEDVIDGNAFWAPERGEKGFDISQVQILYDEQFVDETGMIYPAKPNSMRKICLFGHDIVSGYFQTHVKDDNGGCTVKVYESTRCTKCDTIWVGDLQSTTTWVKCPH